MRLEFLLNCTTEPEASKPSYASMIDFVRALGTTAFVRDLGSAIAYICTATGNR
jgi:hypothetical protein